MLLRTAVSVVTLFSWRATKPADLKRAVAIQDLAGTQTDDVIAEVSRRSPSTLAARGAHGLLFERGRNVAVRLDTPVCLRSRRVVNRAIPCTSRQVPTQSRTCFADSRGVE